MKRGSIRPMDRQDFSLTARSKRMRSALRTTYDRFIRIRGEPKDICFGLALGIFMGISPIFGFQLILAVLIAALLKWNKIAAAMGTLISNPITTPFIYPFAYYVGSRVMGTTTKGHLVIPRDLEPPGECWRRPRTCSSHLRWAPSSSDCLSLYSATSSPMRP